MGTLTSYTDIYRRGDVNQLNEIYEQITSTSLKVVHKIPYRFCEITPCEALK